MAWRGLHISEPARLSLKASRVKIERDGDPVDFPLEDVAWIILDTQQVTATAALMAACMEQTIPLVVCDGRHMPSGVLLPFHQYFRQGETARLQTRLGAPLKKRLWQAIVRAKVERQADTLARTGSPDAETLRAMARHVKSGDPDNVEARAARYYWQRLFADFQRADEADARNGLLNYGYAVVRAALARALVARGLLPAFGIHHDSVQNAFNLADDLIEPLRPLVDLHAWHHVRGTWHDDPPTALALDDRRAMAALLTSDVCLAGDIVSFLAATDKSAAALVRAMRRADVKELQFPQADL